MAIIATDILLKSALEAALSDLRANRWILEDVFAGLANDPLASPEAGWKEVAAAIAWFTETDIPVLLQHRVGDTPKIPCISIAYEPSREMEERASLADDGFDEDYPMNQTGRGIVAVQKITSNFTPDQYDRTDGQFLMPSHVSTESMSVGNYVVAKSGKAYQVILINGDRKFQVTPGTTDDFTDCYIAPKSTIWNARKELTFLSESYSIGCHTQNDPSTTVWLWQIVFYSLLRYKEAFLESRGFELSGLRSSALERNAQFQSENVFSKYVTITGQSCCSWIKFIAPRFESVNLKIDIGDTDGAIDNDTIYGNDSEECPPSWAMDGDFDEDAPEIEVGDPDCEDD